MQQTNSPTKLTNNKMASTGTTNTAKGSGDAKNENGNNAVLYSTVNIGQNWRSSCTWCQGKDIKGEPSQEDRLWCTCASARSYAKVEPAKEAPKEKEETAEGGERDGK
ncbi:hypothetical protein MKZ38_006170 [Zalerion maritima]|uniref:Uncharacterized protein n=1 Tax=Zalerion maritima TaxID=339359 RepID=A0AAD5RJF6_9PEZI|nr:hypothetical protein MKZ38_006170 [Zalerion maritima]